MKHVLLPVALATVLLTACGGGGDTSRPAVTNSRAQALDCNDYSKISQGAYIAASVPWGSYGTGQAYTSCVAIGAAGEGTAFEAKWVTPPNQTNLQEVIFGSKPGYTGSNGVLPKLAKDITRMLATWRMQLVSSGPASVSIGVWLTDQAVTTCLTTLCGNRVEIMINLKTQAWVIADSTNPRVTIDGRDWYMKVGNFGNGLPNGTFNSTDYGALKPNGSAPLQYRAFFQPVVPEPDQGQVDIKQFVQYLVSHGLIPSTLHVSDVEFGVESSNSQGEFHVESWLVQVQ